MRNYTLDQTLDLIKTLDERHKMTPIVFSMKEGGHWILWKDSVPQEVKDPEGYWHDIHAIVFGDIFSAWVWDNVNGFRFRDPMMESRLRAGHRHSTSCSDYEFVATQDAESLKKDVKYCITYSWEEYPSASHGGVLCTWECIESDTGLPILLRWTERNIIEQSMHPHVLQSYVDSLEDDHD